MFLGRWTARGSSYGGNYQNGGNPTANGEPWLSTHDAYWHTGQYFLVQDERADINGARFDTLSIMGMNEDGTYFARSFENHGFYRNYSVDRNEDLWTLTGDQERATVRFEAGGTRQIVTWEWKQSGRWMPLCDRCAIKVDA
jgi:hypothetical protein